MYLNEIHIENYKSIQELTIPVRKYSNSFTSIFVGLNEAGKSNLLEAISLLSDTLNIKTYRYKEVRNRHVNGKFVDLYYRYNFENEDEWKKEFKKNVVISKEFEDVFRLDSYEKNVYLSEDKTSFVSNFSINWKDFCIENFSFSKNAPGQNEKLYIIKHNLDIKENEKTNYILLDEENLSEILEQTIPCLSSIKKQGLSIWRPEEKYLITKPIDLNEFSTNISSSIPLMNLFILCGFDTQDKIQAKIKSLTEPETRTLSKQLSRAATHYINNVWKEHNISIDVNIEFSTKRLNVYIQDKDNADEFFGMNERSQGFKHFISLILHLSISNNKEKCKDQIILIDEPENHLHPSGIRYMRDELLKIGTNNYVFIATHSPFMIDNKNMNRHFIVNKPKGATTITQIDKNTVLADEEVLRMGFGINILKDFLTPYKLLVEGMTDLNIIRKGLFKLNSNLCMGITNGQGGNIVQVASVLKYSEVESLVLTDDDLDGHDYKRKILNLGTPYNEHNVKTIREMCGTIIPRGTIEDTLDSKYVTSIINRAIKQKNKSLEFVNLEKEKPILENLKIYLNKHELNQHSDNIIKEIKETIGNEFNPANLAKHPILKELLDNIIKYFGARNAE